MKFPMYLGLLHHAEATLRDSFRQVADGHGHEPDVLHLCRTLADQCDRHTAELQPVIDRYGEADPDDEPERLHADGLSQTRSGGVGLLRDLQDLYVLASFVDITWTMVQQAAQGLRDTELLAVVDRCDQHPGAVVADPVEAGRTAGVVGRAVSGPAVSLGRPPVCCRGRRRSMLV